MHAQDLDDLIAGEMVAKKCRSGIHLYGATAGHLQHLQDVLCQSHIGVDDESYKQGIRAGWRGCLSMLNLAGFLIGFFVIFGCLFLIGITRGKWVSQKVWVFLWLTVSVLFVVFLCASFVLETVLLSFALGGSLGFVIAVTIHTTGHAINEIRK
jgi:hypothetical protein